MDNLEVSSNEAVQSQEVAPAEQTQQEVAQVAPQAEVVPQQAMPTYTPNWKYKANQAEHELPEEYRGYIKSADDEKRIKRLFEQVHGVEKIKNEYKTASTELSSYKGGIEAVNKLLESGQYQKAFSILGWDKDIAFKAAKQFLDFDELPHNQKELYHQASEVELHNQRLQQEYQTLQGQLQAQAAQLKAVELSNVLSQSEVKSVSERFDSANGPGSFRQKVIQYAHAESLRRGEDITADEAINAVMEFIKPYQQQAQPMQAEPKELPVIPATKGSSTPAQKSFKSVDDLVAYRKAQYGY